MLLTLLVDASAAVAIGAASTFFGYFLLGPVLFTAAFLIGGGICFIAVRAGLDESKASAWLSIVSMLVGGGLCGFLAVKLLGVGMFALGATLGVTASAALKAVVWSKVFPSSPDAGFIFGAVVLGTIFGVAALSLRKKMLILSTSYAGSFAFFFGIGHFAGHFPNLQDLNNVETGVFEPWAVMYMCLTALFGTAGMFVQLHMTRDKSMPSRYPYSRSRRHERLVESGSDTTADWDGEGEHSNRKLLSSSRASAVQSSQNQLQHAPSDYALADNLDWDSATKLDGTSSATLHKTGDRNTDQHRTENDVRLQIGGPNADI